MRFETGFGEVLGPRALQFDLEEQCKLLIISRPLEMESSDKYEQIARLTAQAIPTNSAEVTSCSPVIPHAELERIRNHVVAQYTALVNGYSNVGQSLDARGLLAQYNAVFNAIGSGDYCYYQSDQYLIDDISNSARGAKNVLTNAFNQYTSNFNAKLQPIRPVISQLLQAASVASNDIGSCVGYLNQLVQLNFDFHLYTGLNASLDGLMNEYAQSYERAKSAFDQANARVQGNFQSEARTNNLIYSAFMQGYNTWNTMDGDAGYAACADQIPAYKNSLQLLSKFVVLKSSLNDQIFAEIEAHAQEAGRLWKSFPDFPQAIASTGFILDPGTSARKFYARQKVLNLAQGAGAHFYSKIAPGESLVGTGFSYRHGGQMPPHKEHKNGKDCDIFSRYFKVGDTAYSEQKATAMVVFLLSNAVTRVIYTNATVVAAANKAVPSNPVAVVLGGHETHIHFDMESATVLSA